MIETSSSEVFGNLKKSSSIFGNFQKLFGNVCVAFRQLLESLWKFSKWLAIFGKLSRTLLLVCLCTARIFYNKKTITYGRLKIQNFSSHWKIFHSKRNFVSPSGHVISSLKTMKEVIKEYHDPGNWKEVFNIKWFFLTCLQLETKTRILLLMWLRIKECRKSSFSWSSQTT